MKKILFLLAMLLMIVNVSFAMTGLIEMQTINGVHVGMLPQEVEQKWGQPLAKEYNGFFFKPGGLYGEFHTNGDTNVKYLRLIRAQNNPQLVLQPSGVSIGMSEQEVIRRLGEPDKKSYHGCVFENDIGHIYRLEYVSPPFVNAAGLSGKQYVTVYIRENRNAVLKISLEGFFRKPQ